MSHKGGDSVVNGDSDSIVLMQDELSVRHDSTQEPLINLEDVQQIPQPRLGRPVSDIGSYLSEDQLHCLEGPFEELELRHSMTRATPMSMLYNSSEFGGLSCADRGYTEVLQAVDECFSSSSRWMRPGSPPERTHAGVPSGGLWAEVLDQYDNSSNYPDHTSRSWVACWLCDEGSLMRSGQVWDVDCGAWGLADLLQSMRSVPGGVMSITPVGGEVCLEGPAVYLQNVVRNARRTPIADLFVSREFNSQNCTARGFNKVRKMVDDCWPRATMHIREEGEDINMSNWVGSYHTAIREYNSSTISGGLWATMDWVSCRACSAGSAVRDRGLLATMRVGDSMPYKDVYCDAMNFTDLPASETDDLVSRVALGFT